MSESKISRARDVPRILNKRRHAEIWSATLLQEHSTLPGGATSENLAVDAGDLEAPQSFASVTGQVSSW